MLGYSKVTPTVQRSWLVMLTILLWVVGAMFTHEPYQPYEPYMAAIVKSIIVHDSWFVPYISPGFPYFYLHPFYFWLYACCIKILHISNITNAIRWINFFLIMIALILMIKLNNSLRITKDAALLLLISSIGFIDVAYQLSPYLIVIIGVLCCFYAIQTSMSQPGSASGYLGIGLLLVSINFTAIYLISMSLVLLLLCFYCKTRVIISYIAGYTWFLIVFISYLLQLYLHDYVFFIQWVHNYINIVAVPISVAVIIHGLSFYLQTTLWYLLPAWILASWSIYKYRTTLIHKPIFAASIMFIIVIYIMLTLSGSTIEASSAPLVVPFTLLAAIAIDSIRISVVSLLNSIVCCFCSIAIIIMWIVYLSIIFHVRQTTQLLMFYTDGYQLETSYWRLLLALALMLLWCVVLMRKGLYGRYMLTNWVVGITCSLVTFIALYLPALDHAVSFRKIVDSSMPYLSNSIKYDCVLTNESNKLQNALWYYYADLILVPTNDYKHANRCQTLLLWSADSHPQGWNLVWTAKRVIDKKSFLIFYKKHV